MLLLENRRVYGIKQSGSLASSGANIGILAGLLLVAFEINENSRITKVDLTARSYEHANEYVLSLMGENPTRALVKSTTSPAEMTDEELAKRIFPKKVKEELDKVVHKDDEKQDSEPSRRQSST